VKKTLSLILIFLFTLSTISAQNNVHLFQNFFRDAIIAPNFYAEGSFEYSKTEIYDFDWSTMTIGVKGGYPINNKIEADARINFISITPEEGDGESGISDLLILGKYMIVETGPNIAVGAKITAPIGSEDVGQGNLNFGFFGALRHKLADKIELTGTLGLDFFETTTNDDEGKEDTEYETSLILGAGSIYYLNQKFSIVPEFMIQTEVDYTMLSCGVDYLISSKGRLRGYFGLGLDDGAPDMMIGASYFTSF